MVCVEHVTIALLILLPSLDQELFIIVPPWCPCEAKERDMVLADYLSTIFRIARSTTLLST